MRIERTFKGTPESGGQVSVTVQGHRPTLDPARPSVPYFRAGEELRYVLFLARSRSGATYRLLTLYDAHDAVGQEKIAAVAAVAEIAAVKDQGARGRRMVASLLAGLKATGRWTKAHAARELTYLAGVAPDAIDKATEARIRRLPPAVLTADQRYWLRILYRLLDAHRQRTPASNAPQPEEEPWRATFLQATAPEDRRSLLSRLVQSGPEAVADKGWWAWQHLEPSMRVWFARLLADRGVTSAARMRAAYAGEEEAEVRGAIVRGVGLLGGDEDVTWLGERIRNLGLRRMALLALARVRTTEARALLVRARRGAEGRGETDLADWIEHLLSPAFEESERRVTGPDGVR